MTECIEEIAGLMLDVGKTNQPELNLIGDHLEVGLKELDIAKARLTTLLVRAEEVPVQEPHYMILDSPNLHSAIRNQEELFINLNDLENDEFDFNLIKENVRKSQTLKVLKLFNLPWNTTITGLDMEPFKNLTELQFHGEMTDYEALTLNLNGDLPLFVNLKSLSLILFTIDIDSFSTLCDNIPNVESLNLCFEVTCSCKKSKNARKKGKKLCSVCSEEFLDPLIELKNLKSFIVNCLPNCEKNFIKHFREDAFSQLRYLRLNQESVSKVFVDAFFDFAKKKPKEKFVLNFKSVEKVNFSASVKPPNVKILD